MLMGAAAAGAESFGYTVFRGQGLSLRCVNPRYDMCCNARALEVRLASAGLLDAASLLVASLPVHALGKLAVMQATPV